MFKVQDTVVKIINYNCNMVKVQATVVTIINYSCNMFKVQATGVRFALNLNVIISLSVLSF